MDARKHRYAFRSASWKTDLFTHSSLLGRRRRGSLASVRLAPDAQLAQPNRPWKSGNQIGPRNACGRQTRYIRETMPILSVKHVTTYRYCQPVEFGEHRMMLRPRDDDDQKVLQSQLEIAPQPRELAWERDSLGNHVAIAHFAERSDELRFVSSVCVEHEPRGFHDVNIRKYARKYPFSYTADDWSRLRRFTQPSSQQPELRRWCEPILRE